MPIRHGRPTAEELGVLNDTIHQVAPEHEQEAFENYAAAWEEASIVTKLRHVTGLYGTSR